MEKPKSSSTNKIVFPLTIITFLLSLPILFGVIWLLYMRECNCEYLLQLPKLQIGIVVGLAILFIASNVAIFLRSRIPMVGLMAVMVPLIVILTMGLVLVGAYRMESETIIGSPMWIKIKVNRDDIWNNIKSCLYHTQMCQDLAATSFMEKSYDFSMSKLSPIESGCCLPPPICDMDYVNATYWKNENGESSHDVDCDFWQNGESVLCYNCHACKQGYITTLRAKWFKLGVFLVVITILLILFHLLLFLGSLWENYA